MKIIDELGQERSEGATIAKYFRRPTETVQDMMRQIKELSPADKTELAVGAAKELGWTVQS